MTSQYIQIMYIIECLVVSQQILLVGTEGTLRCYRNQTTHTTCFRILAIEWVRHIGITYIVSIHTNIDLCFDTTPDIDISKPLTADYITRISHHIQHIACQRVCVRDNILTREVSIRTIVVTQITTVVCHNVSSSITDIHRVDSTHNISCVESIRIRSTAFCILFTAIVVCKRYVSTHLQPRFYLVICFQTS